MEKEDLGAVRREALLFLSVLCIHFINASNRDMFCSLNSLAILFRYEYPSGMETNYWFPARPDPVTV